MGFPGYRGLDICLLAETQQARGCGGRAPRLTGGYPRDVDSGRRYPPCGTRSELYGTWGGWLRHGSPAFQRATDSPGHLPPGGGPDRLSTSMPFARYCGGRVATGVVVAWGYAWGKAEKTAPGIFLRWEPEGHDTDVAAEACAPEDGAQSRGIDSAPKQVRGSLQAMWRMGRAR